MPADGPGPLRMEWLMLDPTPSREEAPADSALARWWEQGRRTGQSFWQEMVLGYGSRRQSALWEDLPAKGRFAGGVLFLAGSRWPRFRLARRFRRRGTRAAGVVRLGHPIRQAPRHPDGALEARAVARRGPPPSWPNSARPLVAADTAAGDLADLPARVVESYYRERYGRIPAGPAEVAALSAGLDRLSRAR